ncbi:MAG: SPOR domain-containing protein [Desulfobacteraceae bacterium]|jgi:hypothetical protein
MNAVLRHLSVRFWLTAFAGGMICISLLPWWQRVLGISWLVVPASAILAACFGAVGWVMNRVGMGFLRRQVNEAAAWERAGMMTEAEMSFGKAMATFDSFWLSPLLRRSRLQWFSGLLVRFYLGQHKDDGFARSLISSHLKQFPHDEVVAEAWLEYLLAYERHHPDEHEAVDRIGRRLAGNQRIQRLLMQFYMANGRTDFDAMQTYRMVWQQQQPLPEETLLNLARLLRSEHILNHWALKVYLKAHACGDTGALEGLAAAVRWLPVTEESRPHLKAAEKILTQLDPQQSALLDTRFKSDQLRPVADEIEPYSTSSISAARRSLDGLLTHFSKSIRKGLEQSWKLLSSESMRRAWPAIAIALTLVLAAVGGWRFLSRPAEQPAVQKVPEQEKVVITDPFTIQVAAYVKSEDARRVVDQLIQKGLDAFWTEAASANRTWYQVKVSHFASRQEAQKYGQGLKTKGLIDDFYVANYEHERRNTARN